MDKNSEGIAGDKYIREKFHAIILEKGILFSNTDDQKSEIRFLPFSTISCIQVEKWNNKIVFYGFIDHYDVLTTWECDEDSLNGVFALLSNSYESYCCTI